MTGEKPPPLSERPQEPIDRIWWGAMPTYHLLLVGYGVTAFLFPLRSVAASQGPDRAALFGLLIAATSAVIVGASFRSIWRQKPAVEWWATLVFLALMAVYMVAIYHAAATSEPGVRPGSTFLPLLFAVFPFTRWLVILRSGRMTWPWRRRAGR